MKSKNISILVLFFLIILALTYFNLTISKKCKSLDILKAVPDFGISHLEECYSEKNFLIKTKRILSNNPTLYEIARKFRRTYITSDFKFDNPPTKDQIDEVKKKEILTENIELPFIKGLINQNYSNVKKIETDFIFENWNRSHGDHGNTKFHPGKQINKNNIKKLKLIWKYDALKNEKIEKVSYGNQSLFPVAKQSIESNPIFINNKIISVTANWKIIANNASNGNLIWELQSLHMPGRRGMVSYHDKLKGKYYVFAPFGNKIYKINTKDGSLEKSFGKNGYVKKFTLVAPLIYKNKLIVVGTNSISIFNLNSGKIIKNFSITNPNRNFLRGVVWGGAALDKKNGIIFVNTGNPHPGVYGVNRPGNNKNSCSVIAFDLKKEKIIWTFQETMHDLWDFDLSSPPILHNLKIENI